MTTRERSCTMTTLYISRLVELAEKAGHAMHFALVNRIMSDPTLYEILTFDQLATQVAHALVS